MHNDEVIAPDGKVWYVSIPPDRDRVVFCRSAGRTWQLYRFAKGEQGAAMILRSIALEHGQVETVIVIFETEVDAQ